MECYYRLRCPFHLIEQLATRSGTYEMTRRELAIRMDDGIIWRKGCFSSGTVLKGAILNRIAAVRSIDMGPVYPTRDREKKRAKFIRWRREFTLDIDLDDYDDLRQCTCRGSKNACTQCWAVFIQPAIAVMRHWLEGVFAYTRVGYFFSGGRGVHVWVLDDRAFELSDDIREQLCTIMATSRPPAHVMENTLLPTFRKYVVPWMQHESVRKFIYDRMPTNCRNLIRGQEPESAWEYLRGLIGLEAMQRIEEDLAWECLRPRFDKGPCTQADHLLKLPFSTHQRTQNLVLPLLEDEYRPVHVDDDTDLTPYIRVVQQLLETK